MVGETIHIPSQLQARSAATQQGADEKKPHCNSSLWNCFRSHLDALSNVLSKPSDSNVPEGELLTVLLAPGQLGINFDPATGLILRVDPGGQCAQAGVGERWKIQLVNGRRYSEAVLRSHIAGQQQYSIAFATPTTIREAEQEMISHRLADALEPGCHVVVHSLQRDTILNDNKAEVLRRDGNRWNVRLRGGRHYDVAAENLRRIDSGGASAASMASAYTGIFARLYGLCDAASLNDNIVEIVAWQESSCKCCMIGGREYSFKLENLRLCGGSQHLSEHSEQAARRASEASSSLRACSTAVDHEQGGQLDVTLPIGQGHHSIPDDASLVRTRADDGVQSKLSDEGGASSPQGPPGPPSRRAPSDSRGSAARRRLLLEGFLSRVDAALLRPKEEGLSAWKGHTARRREIAPCTVERVPEPQAAFGMMSAVNAAASSATPPHLASVRSEDASLQQLAGDAVVSSEKVIEAGERCALQPVQEPHAAIGMETAATECGVGLTLASTTKSAAGTADAFPQEHAGTPPSQPVQEQPAASGTLSAVNEATASPKKATGNQAPERSEEALPQQPSGKAAWRKERPSPKKAITNQVNARSEESPQQRSGDSAAKRRLLLEGLLARADRVLQHSALRTSLGTWKGYVEAERRHEMLMEELERTRMASLQQAFNRLGGALDMVAETDPLRVFCEEVTRRELLLEAFLARLDGKLQLCNLRRGIGAWKGFVENYRHMIKLHGSDEAHQKIASNEELHATESTILPESKPEETAQSGGPSCLDSTAATLSYSDSPLGGRAPEPLDQVDAQSIKPPAHKARTWPDGTPPPPSTPPKEFPERVRELQDWFVQCAANAMEPMQASQEAFVAYLSDLPPEQTEQSRPQDRLDEPEPEQPVVLEDSLAGGSSKVFTPGRALVAKTPSRGPSMRHSRPSVSSSPGLPTADLSLTPQQQAAPPQEPPPKTSTLSPNLSATDCTDEKQQLLPDPASAGRRSENDVNPREPVPETQERPAESVTTDLIQQIEMLPVSEDPTVECGSNGAFKPEVPALSSASPTLQPPNAHLQAEGLDRANLQPSKYVALGAWWTALGPKLDPTAAMQLSAAFERLRMNASAQARQQMLQANVVKALDIIESTTSRWRERSGLWALRSKAASHLKPQARVRPWSAHPKTRTPAVLEGYKFHQTSSVDEGEELSFEEEQPIFPNPAVPIAASVVTASDENLEDEAEQAETADSRSIETKVVKEERALSALATLPTAPSTRPAIPPVPLEVLHQARAAQKRPPREAPRACKPRVKPLTGAAAQGRAKSAGSLVGRPKSAGALLTRGALGSSASASGPSHAMHQHTDAKENASNMARKLQRPSSSPIQGRMEGKRRVQPARPASGGALRPLTASRKADLPGRQVQHHENGAERLLLVASAEVGQLWPEMSPSIRGSKHVSPLVKAADGVEVVCKSGHVVYPLRPGSTREQLIAEVRRLIKGQAEK